MIKPRYPCPTLRSRLCRENKLKNGLYTCPCCGYASLKRAAHHEICKICFWEDGGHDDPEAHIFWGPPNYVSLIQGHKNYLKLGVSDPKDKAHVRPATEQDIKLRNYVLLNGEVVIE